MGAGSAPARPGQSARGPGHEPCPGARADPLRADAGLALHVLSRRRSDHGHGPREDTPVRVACPGMRRRAPLELRSLRRTGSPSGVGRQRLRRNPSGALGVGSKAPRSEFRDRRARSRLHPEADPRRGAQHGPPLPRGDAGVRRDAKPRRLVRAPRRRRPARRPGQGRRPQADEGGPEERREGRKEEQHEGLRSPRPGGRRRAANHQRSAASRPRPGARVRGSGPRSSRSISSRCSAVTARASKATVATYSTATGSSRWPARWSGSAASGPGPGWR